MKRLIVLGLVALLSGAAQADDGGKLSRRRIVADDGTVLALYRYVPPGGGGDKAPVLLVPELGMGRAAFDLEGRGLAPFLRARGHEVFVLEPRGSGESQRAPSSSLWTLATRDVAAAVRVIRQRREEPIALVVHGYLGALVMAASDREHRGAFSRIVALSTPALPEVPNAYVEQVLERGGRLSTLPLDPAGAAIFELLFTKHAVMTAKTRRALHARAFSDLGKQRAAELLGWLRRGDLVIAEGDSVRGRLEELSTPTLQLIALRNNWVHPEHATPLREIATRAKVKLRVFSLLQYDEEDYTHLSLLHGAGAEEDVFPLVARYLVEAGE